MRVADNLKESLKKLPPLHSLGTRYRSLEQKRQIENEQSYYEKKAQELGLSRDYSTDEVKRRLKERLSKRGIRLPPKTKEDLHIIFASRPVNWVLQNIAPALKKFANVTAYYYPDHGFADEEKWLNIRDDMNEHFVKFVRDLHSAKPVDLVLTYFSGYRINCQTIETINSMGIVTSAFNLDDRLSFKGPFEAGRYSGPVDVCKCYDLNLTQAPESLVKYRVEGGVGMLLPLGANQDFFYPRNMPFRYDVSFVGTAHGNRKFVINYLRENGIKVETFGSGWPGGFIPDEKVPEIFSSSRINLNFGDIAYTDYQCGKSRDFEIPMAGGLMLTTHNPHLADYFEIDKEIFTFTDKKDCVRQIRRLLNDGSLCENARKSARQRALREHTWESRVKVLLETIGFRKKYD